jgi:hypothetical protein
LLAVEEVVVISAAFAFGVPDGGTRTEQDAVDATSNLFALASNCSWRQLSLTLAVG